MFLEGQKDIAQSQTAGVYSPNDAISQTPNTRVSQFPNIGSSSSASNPKGKAKAVKPPNLFSNDGSFLDRIRRSMKEEEDRKKEKEALERKKHFADRFKMRGKRHPPPNSDTPFDSEETPKKKQKTGQEDERNNGSAQAEYHKAIDSYPGSLKDGGTGVRPLIK